MNEIVTESSHAQCELCRMTVRSKKTVENINFLCLSFYGLRRRRRGSVSTMTPHRCWNVCDWKTTEGDQPSEAQLSLSLFPHAHIESQENHCGHHASERRCTSSFQPSKLSTHQGGTKERTGHPRSTGMLLFSRVPRKARKNMKVVFHFARAAVRSRVLLFASSSGNPAGLASWSCWQGFTCSSRHETRCKEHVECETGSDA